MWYLTHLCVSIPSFRNRCNHKTEYYAILMWYLTHLCVFIPSFRNRQDHKTEYYTTLKWYLMHTCVSTPSFRNRCNHKTEYYAFLMSYLIHLCVSTELAVTPLINKMNAHEDEAGTDKPTHKALAWKNFKTLNLKKKKKSAQYCSYNICIY